jgi:acetyl-CoA carboxylase carboxyltransferase component
LDTVLAEQGPAAHEALIAELTAEWTAVSEPWEAAAHLALDDIIEPAQTRNVLLQALAIAWGEGPRVRT